MLRNDDITLRYFEPQDIDRLSTIRSTSENYDFFYEFEPLNKLQQKTWWENSFSKEKEKNFVISCNKTKLVAGTISIYNIDFRNRKAELGRVFLFDDFLKKGIASASMKLVLEYAFNHLNLNKIYLEVFSNNSSAIDLYKRNGFKEEGCLKSHIYKNGKYLDVLLLSILKDEF